MSDHIADANKMVDTPRMNSVAGHARGIVDAAILAEGMKLERELNAANAKIKRLEEAGDAMASAWDKEWLTDTDIEAIIDYWHGAKEDKP